MNNSRRPSWTWLRLQSACLRTGPSLQNRGSSAASASHGIRSRVCPAVGIPSARLLPDDVAATVQLSHRQVTESRSAGGFSPPRRLTPRSSLGFVAPRSRPGFIAFCDAQPHLSSAETNRWKSNTPPRNAVHTLRRIPLASSRTASPRPLPSCRSVHSPTARAPKHSFDQIARRQATPPPILSLCRNTAGAEPQSRRVSMTVSSVR